MRCATGLKPQTVLFPKIRFKTPEARAWLRAHGHQTAKVDVTRRHLRFRQRSPKSCIPGSYATLAMGRSGIQLVTCCPRK